MNLVDSRERERIATELDRTFVVEAAAGTGKTTALVSRLMGLLLAGQRLSRIAAVTFTEKAAGEMKLRLREEIEAVRRERPEVRAALDPALRELEAAHIGTIHSLCAEILRERPIEAGLDPQFQVIDEDRAQRLFDEAFDAWTTSWLAAPPDGLRRLLRRPAARGQTATEALRQAGWSQVDRRDFRGRWERPPFDRDAAVDRAVEALRALLPWAARPLNPSHHLVKQVREVARWLDELDARERVQPRDRDALEASLRELARRPNWRHFGWRGDLGDGVSQQQLLAARDDARATLEEVVAACDADLAPAVAEALWPLVDAYEGLLRRAGAVDFFDLLRHTRDLLARDDAARHDLQRRFTHLLVDEFQDTDPLQAEILLLLAADDSRERDPDRARPVPGKLFLVGDPKQSIYRFRRADVRLYLGLRERLEGLGAERLHLCTSFRSDPRIQDLVNAAFAPRMRGGAQADYVPLAPARAAQPGRPAIVALSIPYPYGRYGKIAGQAVEERTPAAVAAWIRWLCDHSGWTVDDPDSGEPIAVRPRDVCLLFRRFQGFGAGVAAPYAQALEAEGLPHVLVGGRSLHEREEVLALRAACAAIEWPDDELSVFATLRGPLFAVGDDALLAWRHAIGRVDPAWVPEGPLDPLLEEVAEPLRVIGALHQRRNRRAIADTLVELLDRTRAHAGLALWTGGEQVLANALRVVELARRFERAGATSFRAFVDHLEAQASRGSSGEAPVVEEGTEGVRMMTVHKAKGLEFPIVVLCDVTYPAVRRDPTRWVDPRSRRWVSPVAGSLPRELQTHRDEVLTADAEEADRLLYVAATRARDVLVVPAVADAPVAGWVEALHPALYPPEDARRAAEPAPGCPPFGEDPTPTQFEDRRPPMAQRVRPGLHRVGDVEVAWWDGHLLRAAPPDPSGFFARLDVLAPDAEGRARAGEAQHARWAEARATRIATASAPSERVTTPTALGAGATAPPPGPEVEWAHVAGDHSSRPSGRRFGTLVHAVLAEIPLQAGHGAVADLTALHGRLLGAPAAEVAAAAEAVVAALAHPVLRAAAASPDARREAPIVHRLEDGTVVEGSVDLAYLDDAGWVVVDFKTDPDPTPRAHAYTTQVSRYVEAIAAATGRPARGVLLGV